MHFICFVSRCDPWIRCIFPGLLGVILLFVMVNLVKKGWRPTRLILLIFIISFVGAILGIF